MKLISRKDVVEIALGLMIEVNLGTMTDANKNIVKQIANEVLYDVIKRVYDTPAIEERKESEWIILKEPTGGLPKRWRVRCPICRKTLRIRDKELWGFCPCCGTKMGKK